MSSLAEAIDALLAHVGTDECDDIKSDTERRERFDALDRAVWVEACRAGLDARLPPEPGLGLTHLPGLSTMYGEFCIVGLNAWRNRLIALRDLASNEADGSPQPSNKAGEKPERPKGMTWQEVAKQLERLRSAGEKFTSQGKLAERLGVSKSTIFDAIHSRPELEVWAGLPKGPKELRVLERGHDLAYEIALETIPQRAEPGPDDEAAIREFIEHADPDTKAWFMGLSREEQLEYLNDPDKYPKILGRKV